MDKLKMAHEWFISSINNGKHVTIEQAWCYADAMQAEADKREKIELSNKSIETILNADLSQPMCLEDVSEWQPDWSQAPEWANWWAIRQGRSDALWCVNKPTVTEDCFLSHGGCGVAPSFNYDGNWQDSLRKRPSNI